MTGATTVDSVLAPRRGAVGALEAVEVDRVALAHDYLTQRGGAERVVLSLTRAFPAAPLYTSLYDESGTFAEFAGLDVRPLAINAFAPLRRRHRLALPLLPATFSSLRIPADVLICSSSGWAHASRTDGRKVVYCHAPARWLYQGGRYLSNGRPSSRIGLAVLGRPLRRWDRNAAVSAHRYIANSSWTAQEVERIYGVESEVVHPPLTLDAVGEQRPLPVEPGYVLCVSRLRPYKNLEAVVAAFGLLPQERLVVVGEGRAAPHLQKLAGRNVLFAGGVTDDELRWLYEHSRCLVGASYEDFGLTPVEAAAFGKPTAALRFGGYVDTVREGETGVFFDRPEPRDIAAAVSTALDAPWSGAHIRHHASSFSEEDFIVRMRRIAATV